jgi:phytanoyl-CoA hydroxylase
MRKQMTVNQNGLWIDQEGWEEYLDRLKLKASLKENIRQFIEEGYTILPQAVKVNDIHHYCQQVQHLITQRQTLKLGYSSQIYDVADERVDPNWQSVTILDTYAHLKTARKLIFSDTLLKFICAVFREPPLAFQGLHFERGSTIGLHQDTAYVVVDPPDNFLASWVALEDIHPGSGELLYIPKSHRFKKYYFDSKTKRRYWDAVMDGHEKHDRFLEWLYGEADRLNLSVEMFAPRKGDVLIWHSNLIHGGGPITVPDSTRRSLVTHYCPVSNHPHYFQAWSTSESEKIPVHARAQISSYHYKIPQVKSPFASLKTLIAQSFILSAFSQDQSGQSN